MGYLCLRSMWACRKTQGIVPFMATSMGTFKKKWYFLFQDSPPRLCSGIPSSSSVVSKADWPNTFDVHNQRDTHFSPRKLFHCFTLCGNSIVILTRVILCCFPTYSQSLDRCCFTNKNINTLPIGISIDWIHYY